MTGSPLVCMGIVKNQLIVNKFRSETNSEFYYLDILMQMLHGYPMDGDIIKLV